MSEADLPGLDHLDERLDDHRIELRPGDPAKLDDGRFGADRPSIRVARRHHVVRIRDGDDARAKRDLLAAQPAWIAAAVHALMVAVDDHGHGAVALDSLDEPRSL